MKGALLVFVDISNLCGRNVLWMALAFALWLQTGCAGKTDTDAATHTADISDAVVSVTPAPLPPPMQSDLDSSSPTNNGRQAYDAIVERILARGFQSDYTLLRNEYVNTDLYNPFDRHQREEARAMFEALDANQLKQCVKHANTILDINFTSLAAHTGAAICYGKLDDAEQQELHSRIYDGLINAIAATGNGKSPQSAFVVLSVDEIYDFLQAQDLEVVSQALMDNGNRKFDVMSVRDPRTGRKFDVYFDISAEQVYFSKRLPQR